MTDRLLSPKEAAEWLGFSKQTLNIWRMEGRGPRYAKIGNRVKYQESDLRAWVEARLKGEASANA